MEFRIYHEGMGETKFRKFGFVITANYFLCTLMKPSIKMYIALKGALESNVSFTVLKKALKWE